MAGIFLRKPYDPELPEEEYEIYTDSSAIPDMERRWVRLAYSFMAVISAFLVFMIIRMIQYPEWTRVPMILFEINFIVFLGLGIYRIRKKERHVKKIFFSIYDDGYSSRMLACGDCIGSLKA